MRAVWLALIVAGCAPSLPHFEKDEAHAILQRFTSSASRQELCTVEGRAQYRGAVVSYEQAMAADGQQWPDLLNLSTNPNSIETMVGAALATQLLDPHHDFRGAPKLMAETIAAQRPRVSDTARAWEIACPEMISLQRAIGRRMAAQGRMHVAIVRRGADTDTDRWHEANEHMEAADGDIERAIANVDSKLNAAK